MKRLFPAGAERGQTTEVAALGDAPKWPVKVWCSNPSVHFEPQKDKGKFTVKIDPESPLGVWHVRFYDEDNSTDLMPFVVSNIAEIKETEPDDQVAKLKPIDRLPKVINGVLEKRGDVDTVAVELKQGQWLAAAVQANHGLRSPMDSTLQILSSGGVVLAQNLDAIALDPRLNFYASVAGTYLVRVFAFPEAPDSSINYSGGEAYVYRLTLASDGWVQSTMPLALQRTGANTLKLTGLGLPNESVDVTLPQAIVNDRSRRQWTFDVPGLHSALELDLSDIKQTLEAPREKDAPPQALEVPASVTGLLSKQQQRDRYRIAAERDKKLRISVSSRRLGMPMDPYLRIYDEQGKMIVREDDTAKDVDSKPIFSPPISGNYDIEVTDAFGGGGVDWLYRLDVEPAIPDVLLSLKSDHFQAKLNEPLEIPVTIDRRDGFDKTIKLSIDGLPASVECSAIESTKEGATAKEVKLSLKAKEPFSGPLRIVATMSDESSFRRVATVSGTVEQFWLIAK